jgi:uncharacterized protein (DUF433 family)
MEMVKHIQVDDAGIPRTINQRVKVKLIEQHHRAGESAEAIAAHYGITLADVYAALAYFHDHIAYFEARQQAVQPLIKAAQQRTAALNAKIQDRLDAQDNE